jgi:HAE1 family hydrophobic/amphiphilic exporter-1/multidrug efflux pump
VLARVPGVGQVTVFNGRDYGMRLWLNPDRLASLGLTAGDVADAVREQNLQAAAGQIGQPPSLPGQQFQYTVTTRGRLSAPAEFEDIILRTRSDGSLLRVRDVARVELGAQSYGRSAASAASRRRSSASSSFPVILPSLSQFFKEPQQDQPLLF